LDWKTFKTEFEKRLNLRDPNYLEIIFATALAHRIHGDPPWLFWVAQSGGGKTEVLRTFRDVPDTKYVESLTPKTLVSHFGSGIKGGGNRDYSLLPKLKDKCLIIKDFTNILSMKFETRELIFSQLRSVFDGEYDTATGLGEKSYQAKFGIIAGVTPAIEKRRSFRGALGERFLMLKMFADNQDARERKVRDAIRNAIAKPKLRIELKKLTTEMMASVPLQHKDMEFKFNVSRDQHEWFARMSELLARMRGSVTRNGYKHEIIEEPDIELGTRIADQIMHLYVALRLLVDPDDALRATARVVKDSVPSVRAGIAEHAYANGHFRVGDYSSVISPDALLRHAGDLVALGVLRVSQTTDGKTAYELEKGLMEDIQGLFGGEKELRKQRPGMWE